MQRWVSPHIHDNKATSQTTCVSIHVLMYLIPECTVPSAPLERCHKVLDREFVLPGWQTSHSPAPRSPPPAQDTHRMTFRPSFTTERQHFQGILMKIMTDQPARWHHRSWGAPGVVLCPHREHEVVNYTGRADYSAHHCKTKIGPHENKRAHDGKVNHCYQSQSPGPCFV